MWRELIVIVAAVAGAALTARLGWWQLDRADQKLTLQATLDARTALPPLDASMLARDESAAREQHFRRVSVSGRWIADRTVFLDNRPMDGKVGFFVVTPLRLDDGAAVLVQRGWLPRNFVDRTALPRVDTPAERVTVEGTLAPSLSRLFQFSDAASGPIRQNLDLASFARETGLDLRPVAIVQRDAPGTRTDGLLRRWPPPATDVQKHYGYAFQWFALAAVIVILYVWHRLIRPRFRRL
ncbi:MAG TPA: SURF1 family protein [Caldimonas sp.]|jgi:surfeit locus 1 family protein|nr:SURF1 family protein [Caldimonas sp.]HEX2540838.1 SURF1 family protein [Caldimonas sp.]